MKQNLLNKLWLRVWMIVAVMTTALAGTAWADDATSTLTFNAKCNGSGTADDGAAWTVTSDGTESNFDNTKGIHYGTNSAQVQYIQLSTSDISGTITKVVVNASAASGVSASVSVNVGGSAFGGDAQSVTTSAVNYTFEGSASGEIVVKLEKPSLAAKALYVKSIAVTYTTGGGDTPLLDDCDLALTGAPVALNFDLYNNSSAQVINYTTSSTGAITIADNDYATFDIDEENKTITVTPTAVTPSEQTITVSQAADESYKAGSATFTVTITDSTPIPTHTATFSVNGVTSTQDFEEGAAITFPDDPADVSGKTFVGWVTEAIEGTADEAPEFVTSANMGQSDVTYYAVFAYANGSGSAEVVDVLTTATFGSPSSYSDWSGKQAENGSDAVYAGQSTTNSGNIQLRATSPSGIITTTSGGKAKKVSVTWASNTTSGRILEIFGSNTAYTSASQLYNAANWGTNLGEIVYGTSTELAIADAYEYIGIKSKTGALYLSNINITWSTGGGVTYSGYCTTVVAAAVARPTIEVEENPFVFSTTATITCETEDATIYYRYSENDEWAEYTAPLTITATTTLYAKAVKDENESEVASVTITKSLAVPTVAIDATGITNTNVYDGTEAGSLAASVTYNDAAVEGATVTWSGNNDEVATIDENGAVTLVAAGTVTFTATYAGNEDYAEKTATYEMTVTNSDPNAPGTENNPYTVAQAVEFIGTLGTATSATEVYVSGIISQVDSYNSTYSSIQYWISDDGTTTGQMEVYSGKGLNGADFSSVDDLKVGDIVTVKGYVKMYKGTPEFDKNNILVSFERPVVTTPYIEVSATTVEATATGLDGTITLTYNNLTDVLAEVQFVEADGTTPVTYAWVAADINGDNNVEYVIEENTSTEARTAYMKVYAVGNEGDAYSELITITQAGYVVDYATLPFAWNGGTKEELLEETGVTASGLGTNYGDNNAPYRVKLDGTGDYIEIKTDSQPVLVSLNVKMIGGATTSTITVQESADGETFTDVEELSISGSQNTVLYLQTANAFDAATRYVRLYFTKGSNVGLGGIAIEKDLDAVTVGTVGYATYVTKHNVSFPSDVEAYITSEVNTEKGYVSMTQVTAVPKGTPVVLKNEGTFTLAPAATDALADVSANELKASDTDIEADGTQYVLAKPTDQKIGFYKATGTIAAGKAYLQIAGEAPVKGFTFKFDDDATAIDEIVNGKLSNGNCYNLAGQRISKMQRGINIVNGKKILK